MTAQNAHARATLRGHFPPTSYALRHAQPRESGGSEDPPWRVVRDLFSAGWSNLDVEILEILCKVFGENGHRGAVVVADAAQRVQNGSRDDKGASGQNR